MHRVAANAIVEYFEENKGFIFFVSLFFLTGIIAGVLIINFLDAHQRLELNNILTFFLKALKSESTEQILDSSTLLKASYQKNLGLLLLMWLSGHLWIGSPLILFILLNKGVSLGFTVGLLVYHSPAKGLLFSFLSIFPHNLFFVPAFIGTAAAATTYSVLKFRERFSGKYFDKRKQLTNHSYFIALMLLCSLLGGLIEAFVTPVFIRLVFLIF